MGFQRILVGLDHSSQSQKAFERSLALAQACGGRLHLFHCLVLEVRGEPTAPPLVVGGVGLGTYRGGINHLWKDQLQTQVEQAIAKLQDYSQFAVQQGVPVEFSYKIGEPGHCLCELAQTWKADMLVVGRRGRTGLTAALLGSISNYVVHHAPCCVLVVQAG